MVMVRMEVRLVVRLMLRMVVRVIMMEMLRIVVRMIGMVVVRMVVRMEPIPACTNPYQPIQSLSTSNPF